MTAPAAFSAGQRVKYVGITGRADGLTGRVIRQYPSGVLIRWSDGQRYSVHPEDLQAVAQ